MKINFILIISFLTLIGCKNQNKIDTFTKIDVRLPYVDSITDLNLKDKTLIEFLEGSLVDYTSKGKQELEKILKKPSYLNNKQTSKLLVEILLNENCFHLHNFAGEKLAENRLKQLEKDKISKSNYIQLRINHSYEDVLIEGGVF